MPRSRRALAALLVGLACVTTALAGAAVVAERAGASSRVSLRQLSAVDVLAVPAPRRPGDLRVVVLGDSVATGNGCRCRPFGPRLAALLAARSHDEVLVSTLARDGAGTPDLLTQLRSDRATIAALKRASAVTVTIGANDFDEERAEAGCAAGGRVTACYDSAVGLLRSELPLTLRALRHLVRTDAQVLVTGYWGVFRDGDVAARKGATYRSTSDRLTRQVNDVVRQAAADVGATYVDLYGAFRGDGSDDDTALLAADGDHPSAAGHRRIAELLARAIRER